MKDYAISAFAPVSAGKIDHPNKRAVPFSLRDEFLEVDGGGTFGTTGLAKAVASVTVQTQEPLYLRGIYLAQYRSAGDPPLGTYLPPSGFRNDGNGTLIQGLNFTWEAESTNMARNWQDGLRDSLMLGPNGYYKLPEDAELTKNEIITVSAQPLVAAAGGDAYRMFLLLDCYKMVG